MEKGEIWLPTVPETPKPITTKFGMGDKVGAPIPVQKYHDPIRGFPSSPPPLPRAVRCVQSDSASYFGGGGVSSLLQSQDHCTDFLRINTSNDVVSRKDVPFEGPKNKILHFNLISFQNANFWPIFDGTLKISRQKSLSNGNAHL